VKAHRLIIAFLAGLLLANLCTAKVRAIGPIILGPGALAPAQAGCLERVQDRRLNGCCARNLGQAADPGTVLVAVEDCALIGQSGTMIVDGLGAYPVLVVDCQQASHEPLSERGLVADVSAQELGHKRAVIILWE
jgi:hypothetical protein